LTDISDGRLRAEPDPAKPDWRFTVRLGERVGVNTAEPDSDLLSLRGLIASDEGDDTGAEANLRAAVQAAPDNPAHAVHLARFLVRRGRASEARTVIEGGRTRTSNSHPETPYWDHELDRLQRRLETTSFLSAPADPRTAFCDDAAPVAIAAGVDSTVPPGP